jgi:YggT family protein
MNIIFLLIQLIQLLFIARVLLSWFPNLDQSNPFVRFIYEATEPVLKPIRDFLSSSIPQLRELPIDFSPLVVFIGLALIANIIF